MVSLVRSGELTPFILFMDGKAVRWSDIAIIRDWSYSYIVVTNCDNTTTNIETIILPRKIRYTECHPSMNHAIAPTLDANHNLTFNSEIVPGNLYFDNEGLLSTDGKNLSMKIEFVDPYTIKSNPVLENNYLKLDENLPEAFITTATNVIAFKDGKLFSDLRFYLDFVGVNTYHYLDDPNNVVFKSYYWSGSNKSKNMIYDIPNQDAIMSKHIEVKSSLVSSEGTDSLIDDYDILLVGVDYKRDALNGISDVAKVFQTPFDFKFSRQNTYSRNISEAVSYISSYNMNLLRDFYKEKMPIEIISYTGRELLNKGHNSNNYTLRLSRARTSSPSDFVVVFRNNKLYDHMSGIVYTNRVISIPISNLKPEDKIEIIKFTNVCNYAYDIIIKDKDEIDYLSSDIRYDNFELFGLSQSGSEEYASYTPATMSVYEVGIKDYINQYSGNKYEGTRIELQDPYYYNKPLRITHKRQFHYMHIHVQEMELYDIILKPEFRYALNKNQYLVFLNQVRVMPENWELYTTKNGVESPQICIFDSVTKEKRLLVWDDEIDIIYIPNPFIEIPFNNFEYKTNDTSDVIMDKLLLDMDGLEYPFDADLFYMFINGKKVHRSEMNNIAQNRVRIDLDGINEPLENATMMKFFDPDSTLSALYSYGDLWTKSIDSLTDEEYKLLFSKIKK